MPKTASIPVNRIFRAFSDATRLRILSLLKEGEHCVGDLVTVLGLLSPRYLAIWPIFGKQVSSRSGGTAYGTSTGSPRRRPRFHKKLIECLSACFGDVPKVARDAQKGQGPQEIRRLLSGGRLVRA
jgi:hypothetical protein